MTSRVHRCLLFSFNLLTIAVSSQFTVRLFYAHFHSLLSSLGGITRFIDLQMRGFSSFPQFWLLRCSWERWAILLQYGSWDWGLLLLFSLAGFCTACGARDFAPLRNDYTSSSLRFQGSYLCAFLADPLPLEFLPRAEELYEPRSRRGRGESDWTGLRS